MRCSGASTSILQDEFDGETLLAWSAAFDMIAETMVRVMVNQVTAPKLPEHRGHLELDTDCEPTEDPVPTLKKTVWCSETIVQ